MKQYITKFLKSVAGFFLAFPLLYIIGVAVVFDVPLEKCVGILLSPFYYLVSISILAAGYGFWEMRRWSWYVFVLSQLLLTYENAIILQRYSESHNKLIAFIFVVLLQAALAYRVAKEVRVPYFFPSIRWWESNPRFRLSVPVEILRKEAHGTNHERNSETLTERSAQSPEAMQKLEGQILDLSQTGCFIKLREEFQQGEEVILDFRIYGFHLQCLGIAVWNAQSTVTHPKGIGIKFTALTKPQKRSLRVIHRRLKRIGLFYRKFRYLLTQDEFLRKMGDIESGNRPGNPTV